MQAARLNVIIPADHKLELALPADLPVGPAEIIVLIPPVAQAVAPHRKLGIDAGKGWIAGDFDAPLPADVQSTFEGNGDEP